MSKTNKETQTKYKKQQFSRHDDNKGQWSLRDKKQMRKALRELSWKSFQASAGKENLSKGDEAESQGVEGVGGGTSNGLEFRGPSKQEEELYGESTPKICRGPLSDVQENNG